VRQLDLANLACGCRGRGQPTDAQTGQTPRFREREERYQSIVERMLRVTGEIAVGTVEEHRRTGGEEAIDSAGRQHTAGRAVRRAEDDNGALHCSGGTEHRLER